MRVPRRTPPYRVIAAVLAAGIAVACSKESPVAPHAASPAPPTGAVDEATQGTRPRVVPGEFLVKFKPSVDKSRVAAALGKSSLAQVGSYRSIPGLRRVRLQPGVQLAQAKTALEQSADVEYVEPNYIVSARALPNDPEFPRQWGLHNLGIDFGIADADIDAPEAWDITTGSANVVVAIIDSGVDYGHEDLAANIFSSAQDCNSNGVDDDGNGYADDCHGIDTANDDSDPMDDVGHGTHVAGTIGALGNNGIGVAGVAWQVRILPCKFLGSDGTGSTADAIECLDYIATLKARGVNVVASNNSWGGLEMSLALQDAIAAQRELGVLFVAAAGNELEDNDVQPAFPCSYDLSNIICVAATQPGDVRPTFSNYGSSTVHLGAPGEGVLSTLPGNQYGFADGTSMATPHVTGVLALLAAQAPARDWRALKNLVLASGDPLANLIGWTITGRRLNAHHALTCADSVVLARLQPLNFTLLHRAVGARIPLKVLHIDCASPNGTVTVDVEPSGETITLQDNGAGQDEAAGDGIYSGTWTTAAAGTFTLSFSGLPDESVTVEVDPQLKPGFPVQTLSIDEFGAIGTRSGASVLAGNVDDDPQLEIFVSGIMFGPLHAWNHDGSPLRGWPVWDVQGAVFSSLGELDGDRTRAEIAAAIGFVSMFAYSGDGTRLPGWPRTTSGLAPPVMIDVDGDGLDEVVAVPVRHADGAPLIASVDYPPGGADAAADLDVDGEMEFVAANGESVAAANRSGMLPGFPAPLPHQPGAAGDEKSVVGDVDGDGKLEIVVAERLNPSNLATVHVFSNAGRLERTLLTDSVFGGAGASLADLDGDGIPEILLPAANRIYAWRGDGTPVAGWPVSLGANAAGGREAVVGDINGDGRPDVAATAQQFFPFNSALLYVFDSDGTPLADFPKPFDSTSGGVTPAIADIDLDGRNDVIVATAPLPGRRDGVFAYDLHGAGPYGPIEWGQYQGGADHRGYYETGKNLPGHAYLSALAHGAGNITAPDGGIDCGLDCIQRYAKGASVTLTARADAGASFDKWLGACAGQGNPCVVAVNRYTAVAAQFDSPLTVSLIGSGSGTVTSAPAGISCPGDCAQVYHARTVVTLTARPAVGSGFDGWSGACSGTNTTCKVTIDAAHTVAAKFVTARRLTVTSIGTGHGTITSAPAGIDCGSTCDADFAPGASLVLTATPDAASVFTGWTTPCPSFLGLCEVTMDAAKTVTATFARKSVLTITRTGSGSGRITAPTGVNCQAASCSVGFHPQDVVSLQAEPAFDSQFMGWSGACSGTGCLLFMDQDRSVTATFALKPTLTVTVGGSGSGTVSGPFIQCTGGSCSAMYESGTPVTLTAEAGAGSTFTGWSGVCTGQSSLCTVTMDSNRSVTATFVSTTPSNPGGGTAGGNSGGGGGGGGSMRLADLALMLLVLSLGCALRRRVF